MDLHQEIGHHWSSRLLLIPVGATSGELITALYSAADASTDHPAICYQAFSRMMTRESQQHHPC
jgi:hypothetical protein